MNIDDQKRLEASIHRVLRSLPERKAPSSLEMRVMAEVARRAALPWWRKSFAYWPGLVRALFFVAGIASAALAVAVVFVAARSAGAHQISQGASGVYAWFLVARDVFAAVIAQGKQYLATLPPFIVYGTVAILGICYAGVAFLGAAAFRALRPSIQNSQTP